MDELVQRLSSGMHNICADHIKSAQELKESIDRGYVLVKFPDTRGGTVLGTRLDKTRSVLSNADFSAGAGTVQLVGSLVLNYNEVELIGELDLATLQGEGCLKLIADEPTWRAKQAQQEAESKNGAH